MVYEFPILIDVEYLNESKLNHNWPLLESGWRHSTEGTPMKSASGGIRGWHDETRSDVRPLIIAVTGLALTLIVVVLLRSHLPADALLPATVLALFALAAVSGLAGAASSRPSRAAYLQAAGALTFIGIVVAALVEPDQLVRLVTSERSDG